MFGLVRTAVRFFFIGFGVGVLLAPRTGANTRQLIREKINLVVGSILEVADLPPVEASADAKVETARSRPRGRSESGAGAKG